MNFALLIDDEAVRAFVFVYVDEDKNTEDVNYCFDQLEM